MSVSSVISVITEIYEIWISIAIENALSGSSTIRERDRICDTWLQIQ